jgi:hypothetical protein
MCKRVSREPGIAVAFLRQKTRWDVRFNKSPAHKRVSLRCELDGEHETGNNRRYCFPILKERKMKMKHGSRSALIVPLESRETDPREPVSREGDASYYGIDVEKHSLHQEVKYGYEQGRVIQAGCVNETAANSKDSKAEE